MKSVWKWRKSNKLGLPSNCYSLSVQRKMSAHESQLLSECLAQGLNIILCAETFVSLSTDVLQWKTECTDSMCVLFLCFVCCLFLCPKLTKAVAKSIIHSGCLCGHTKVCPIDMTSHNLSKDKQSLVAKGQTHFDHSRYASRHYVLILTVR